MKNNSVFEKVKRFIILIIPIIFCVIIISCEETTEDENRNTELLTSHIWLSDSLLAGGEEEGGPGDLLEKFAGETKFDKDGTGTIGQYEGTWQFNDDETLLIITSDSLPAAVTTIINELTEISLKVSTIFPINNDPTNLIGIRMTFVPKEE